VLRLAEGWVAPPRLHADFTPVLWQQSFGKHLKKLRHVGGGTEALRRA
jgi:hypothetical protein